MKHTIIAKLFSHSDEISEDKLVLSDKEYKRYLRRDFPVSGSIGDGKITFWLDENDFYHRDGNQPALIEESKSKMFSGQFKCYFKHGKSHRTDGTEIEGDEKYFGQHFWALDGVQYRTEEEWRNAERPFYFLREKIITLKKLLEIPELYQEVYYAHKSTFLSLLSKI